MTELKIPVTRNIEVRVEDLPNKNYMMVLAKWEDMPRINHRIVRSNEMRSVVDSIKNSPNDLYDSKATSFILASERFLEEYTKEQNFTEELVHTHVYNTIEWDFTKEDVQDGFDIIIALHPNHILPMDSNEKLLVEKIRGSVSSDLHKFDLINDLIKDGVFEQITEPYTLPDLGKIMEITVPLTSENYHATYEGAPSSIYIFESILDTYGLKYSADEVNANAE